MFTWVFTHPFLIVNLFLFLAFLHIFTPFLRRKSMKILPHAVEILFRDATQLYQQARHGAQHGWNPGGGVSWTYVSPVYVHSGSLQKSRKVKLHWNGGVNLVSIFWGALYDKFTIRFWFSSYLSSFFMHPPWRWLGWLGRDGQLYTAGQVLICEWMWRDIHSKWAMIKTWDGYGWVIVLMGSLQNFNPHDGQTSSIMDSI